jgi:PAS domain S-box-containing protein
MGAPSPSAGAQGSAKPAGSFGRILGKSGMGRLKAVLLSRSGWVVSLVMILGVGLVCTVWVVKAEVQKRRQTLITEARLVANAINTRYIKDLTGTPADLESPSYQRLKEQLALVRSAQPGYRFLYLMGRRPDGRVFFYVDSEPAGSKDESPPGQTYDEATETCRRAFLPGQDEGAIEGPYADRWGRWVSGLVPILDPESGKILAVFGADVDVSTWFGAMTQECVPPIAITFMGVAFIAIFYTLQRLCLTRRAAESLRQSEARFSTLFRSSPAPIAMARLSDGRFVDVNEAWQEMTGYSREEAVGHGAAELELWHDPQQRDRLVETVRKEGKARQEVRVCRKFGEVVDVLMSADLVEVAGEVYVITIGQDISDRKRAEENLKFWNALMATQQEVSLDGILVVDETGGILSFNRRFVALWGISPEVAASKSSELILHSMLDKLEQPRDFLEKVAHLLRHRDQTSQDELTLKEGRILDRYSAPMVGSDGTTYGRVWYFRDITESKRSERAVAEANVRLQGMQRELKEMQSQTVANSSQ